ncbi:hypothetical protein HHI36_021397 [Cryptolaemus montrouzieri]|uniref:Uncharacterized protein n=1 Tax=Cryptolaemus montrouzieri TaxID=559131 RepID=A0ABD2MXM9_9CUCU
MCFDMRVTSIPIRVYENINGYSSSSKLDYILTSATMDSCRGRVYEAHIGDHRALFLDYCFSNGSEKASTREPIKETRSMTPQNLDILAIVVSDVSFEDVYVSSYVDHSFERFIDIKQSISVMYIRHKGDSSKGWISDEIKQAGQGLKKLHWLKTNLKNDLSLEI